MVTTTELCERLKNVTDIERQAVASLLDDIDDAKRRRKWGRVLKGVRLKDGIPQIITGFRGWRPKRLRGERSRSRRRSPELEL